MISSNDADRQRWDDVGMFASHGAPHPAPRHGFPPPAADLANLQG